MNVPHHSKGVGVKEEVYYILVVDFSKGINILGHPKRESGQKIWDGGSSCTLHHTTKFHNEILLFEGHEISPYCFT